jgi:hypothetical protein
MFKYWLVSLALVSLVAAPAFAGEYKNATRLGGSTSFYHPPLEDRQTVKVFVNKTESDITFVLREAGLSNLQAEVIKTLRYGYLAPAVNDCNVANPVEGALIQCNFQVGSTLEWMAYRPGAKSGNKTPGFLKKVRWNGTKPFAAYLFIVNDDGFRYTFVVPKDCGNFSLKSVNAQIIEVQPEPTPEPEPVPVPEPPCDCPPPPSVEPEVITLQPINVTIKTKRRLRAVVEADFGKDRRTRNREDGKGIFSQCTPLLGAKVGALYTFENKWEFGGAVGSTFPLVNKNKKAKQNEAFADVEVNRYLGDKGAYVGGGLSFWDVTRTSGLRNSYTPAILMHFGIPVGFGDKVHIVGEDRIFTKQLDNISNNYQFWVGMRVKL